jgi:Domain of unknown function (DUF4252)
MRGIARIVLFAESALLALLLCAPVAVFAQEPDFGGMLKKLGARAAKTVDVNLDQSMLQFASAFLDPKDPDQAQAKKVIANMKGIYVHHFEFDKDDMYTDQDVASLRAPLKGPEWSRIVNVRTKRENENVEVYFRKEGGKFTGLVIIATQPAELTYVNIVGPIDPEDLRQLGGQFGIPKVEIDQNPAKKGESK